MAASWGPQRARSFLAACCCDPRPAHLLPYQPMPFALSLEGKVALITGGSRGIGAATVRAFVAAGAKVMFNYQSARSQAGAVARFGRLDILVANHGIWPPQEAGIDVMSDAQWRTTIAVNLDSVFALIRHAVAQMKKQRSLGTGKGGHIVLISSTAGQRGEAFHVDYAATKGALISMVKGLSTELAPQDIYVNCVAPGWVDTDMSRPALNDPKAGPEILATIPLGRVGTPEEIAAPILFLCTEHAGFITGEVLNVNGGAVLIG